MILISIKQKIPWGVKIAVRRILYFGFSKYCNCCQSNLRRFLPGGKNNRAILEHSIVGAGYHKQDACPVCHAGYRQRLLMLYIDINLSAEKAVKLLHLAPEQPLYYYFSSLKPVSYHYGDLFPEKYSYYCKNPKRIDITDIQYADHSFDIIIASHILEHIPDDKKVMREIYRLLKPGGWAVLQVPISWSNPVTIVYEDVASDEERLERYGQKDHVRIYGADYIERLRNAGFRVELFKPEDVNPKWALDENEILIVGHKEPL